MPSLTLADLPMRKAYDLLVAAIQPRPIAFVSTVAADGARNLAPFSFFMPGGASPCSLAFSPSLGPLGKVKDTLRNIEQTREFVVNTVDRSMAEGMNAASADFAPGVSEWEASGFTPLPSDLVRPPRVAESRIQMECRLFQVVRHGDGTGAACYVIGEILRMHVHDSLWREGSILASELRPISRLGGPNYLDLASLEVFSMARPSSAQQEDPPPS